MMAFLFFPSQDIQFLNCTISFFFQKKKAFLVCSTICFPFDSGSQNSALKLKTRLEIELILFTYSIYLSIG